MASKKLLVNVYSLAGEKVSEVNLEPTVFGVKENKQVMYDAVKVYQANMRQDTAKTKKLLTILVSLLGDMLLNSTGIKPATVYPFVTLSDPPKSLKKGMLLIISSNFLGVITSSSVSTGFFFQLFPLLVLSYFLVINVIL